MRNTIPALRQMCDFNMLMKKRARRIEDRLNERDREQAKREHFVESKTTMKKVIVACTDAKASVVISIRAVKIRHNDIAS